MEAVNDDNDGVQKENIEGFKERTGRRTDEGQETDEQHEESKEQEDEDKEEQSSNVRTTSARDFLNKVTPCSTRGGEGSMPESMRLFREQEVANGNCIDWKKEKDEIFNYCKWNVFPIVKFPEANMLLFSVKTEDMTKEQKYSPIRLISWLVINKYASDIPDKQSWWNQVQGQCIQGVGHQWGAVSDAVKKEFIGK